MLRPLGSRHRDGWRKVTKNTSCIVHNLHEPTQEDAPLIISETFSLSAPRARVAPLLCDVDAVRSCVPGVTDVAKIGPNEYTATLVVEVGPIRSSFEGSIKVDDSRAPAHLAAKTRGKDRTGGSTAEVALEAVLEESSPDTTTVTATADVTIRGRLGSFGSGVIQATAKQMLTDFVSCVDARLSTQTSSAPTAASRPVRPIHALLIALWERVRLLIRPRRGRRETPER